MNRWLIAVKLQALPKTLLPVCVGMGLGYGGEGAVPWLSAALVLALTALLQWAIVLLNDYADRAADVHHAQAFPQLIDERVLVAGLLTPAQVLTAGLLAGAGALACAVILWWLGSPLIPALTVSGLLLIWAYSFAPLRLNYRGGGEILETVGTGVVMPLMGYCAMGVEWDVNQIQLLVPVALYALIAALASGLKHEPADRENGKKTLSVWVGAAMVKRIIWGAQILSRIWCGLLFLSGAYGMYAVIFAALAPALPMYMTRRYDSRAAYGDLISLSAYKKSIQQAAYLTYAGLLLDFVLR